MIFVNTTHQNPIRSHVISCFKKGALALSRSQHDLLRAHKYGILKWCLNNDCGIDRAIDEPGFDYWILRIGFLCNTELDYSLDNNLKLFEAWLFVTINK